MYCGGGHIACSNDESDVLDWEFDQWRGGKAPKVQQDRDDLNREISGELAGRIARFGVGGHENSEHPEAKKKREKERAYRSMLQILLLDDAQYADMYYRVQNKLHKAYQSVERVMSSIGHDLSKSQETLIKFENDATKLDDGTAVFQSLDGSIFTESGQRLSDGVAQNIAIKPGAPGWEEYRDVRDRYLDLYAQRDDILRYKIEVLDHAAERMADHDDPALRAELESLSIDIEERMPEVVQQYAQDKVAKSYHELRNEKSLSLGDEFSKAKDKVQPPNAPLSDAGHEAITNFEPLQASQLKL